MPLYARLYKRYTGIKLPPVASALEQEMSSLGVAEKQTRRARQTFYRSAEQAGFFQYGSEKLVMPSVSGKSGAPSSQAGGSEGLPGEERKTNGGNGGGGRHDLIQGLIKQLPPESSTWATLDRYKWLQAANMIFDLIYENDGEGGLKIEIEDSAK